MSWIAAILFVFLALRTGVALFNLLSHPYLPHVAGNAAAPRISVLIPARNEELRVGRLLDDLLRDEGDLLEIIIYDDQSDDATARIVDRYAAAHPRIRLLGGGTVPAGWLGKNHACDRLAEEAKGDVLLFLDADVRIAHRAPLRAACYLAERGCDLLSLFPRQEMAGAGTRAVVPLMNWILLSLLPLKAVEASRRPSLAAANGQFMAFTAESYRALRPHRLLRSSPAEDIAIARAYKERGRKISVLLGSDDASCRMYERFGEALAGFAKNVFHFFGGHAAAAYAFAATTTLGPLCAWAAGGWRAAGAYVGAAVALRLCVARAGRQSAAQEILWMIPQQIVLWILLFTASRGKRRRELRWKGRNIYGSY